MQYIRRHDMMWIRYDDADDTVFDYLGEAGNHSYRIANLVQFLRVGSDVLVQKALHRNPMYLSADIVVMGEGEFSGKTLYDILPENVICAFNLRPLTREMIDFWDNR